MKEPKEIQQRLEEISRQQEELQEERQALERQLEGKQTELFLASGILQTVTWEIVHPRLEYTVSGHHHFELYLLDDESHSEEIAKAAFGTTCDHHWMYFEGGVQLHSEEGYVTLEGSLFELVAFAKEHNLKISWDNLDRAIRLCNDTLDALNGLKVIGEA